MDCETELKNFFQEIIFHQMKGQYKECVGNCLKDISDERMAISYRHLKSSTDSNPQSNTICTDSLS